MLASMFRTVVLFPALFTLSACGVFEEDEEILPGDRIPVRPAESTLANVSATPLSLAAPVSNDTWSHKNGSATHTTPHPALSGGLTRLWRSDIGDGDNSTSRLTASPIVAEGRVYTLDAAAEVRAFGTGGDTIWATYVGSENESGRDGFGGGLAYDSGKIYVTTGFGEVLALSPSGGEILWRTNVEGPVRAAPTVTNGRVFVVTRQDIAFGLDANSGTVLWRLSGATGITGLLGGASPASDGVVTILPFTSGEIAAVLGISGRRIWSQAISGGRRGLARTEIGDITSDPVIVGDAVLVANQSGRLVSLDRRTGGRNWTANEGSYNAVWSAGGSIFMISDEAELLRLDAATGRRVWSTRLPQFGDPEDRDDAIGYGGPVLAGGRLILASSTGDLIIFDPENGSEMSRVDIGDGSILPPAVAGGRLYVVTQNGSLVAFQ